MKTGFDPTAPDLHLGHTVLFQKMRDFQDLGHQVVLLVGDFTARIGDPTGRSATRPPLSLQEIEENARTYTEQAFLILHRQKTQVVFNSAWLAPLTAETMIRLSAITTVARMIEREDFAKRYAAGAPIGLHEFLYPLLQGYDSVALKADVELGGMDQKFNLLMGREIQRQFGQAPQAVILMPLLQGLDGVQKMSKSLGNAIGITEPPEEMFAKIMSISDDLMWRWIEVLIGMEEKERFMKEAALGRNPKEIKEELASLLVGRFHGKDAASHAWERFNRIHKAREVPEEMETVCLFASKEGLPLAVALRDAGLARSTSEASRLILQKGVRLDGEVAQEGQRLFPGQELVAQVGRRRFARIVVQKTENASSPPPLGG